MTDRGLTAASITALEAGDVEYYYLIRIDFSTPVYYTLAPYNIDYDGNTYVSTSIIKDIPAFTESLKIKPSTWSLKMAGASATAHALTLTEDSRGVEVFVYMHIESSSQTVQITKGYIDGYSIDDDPRKAKSSVTWKVANHWSNWSASEGRFLSDSEQQAMYANDFGLKYASIPPNIAWWGDVFSSMTAAAYRAALSGGELTSFGNWPKIDTKTFESVNRDANEQITEGAKSALKKRLPVIYGEAIVTGIPVFKGLSGAGNKYLWVAYAICEGPAEDLVDITINDKSYTDADISGNVQMVKATNFHAGSTTQTADADLVTEFAFWNTQFQLKGICYCVIRYEYDESVLGSEPEAIFHVKGRKIYDPRSTLTTYKTNPALVLYDYLTSTGYGKAISSADLDVASFEAGADYCDTTKTDHDGVLGGAPISITLFDFNGIISTEDTIKKNVEKILFTMRGHLPYINGKYTLVIERDDDSGTFNINEDNLTGNFRVSESGITDIANYISYDFIDADLNFQAEQVIVDSATFLAIDNNKVLKKSFKNIYESNRYRAENRAATILKKTRQQIVVECSLAFFDSLRLECGKIINLTRDLQGWSGKEFRIEEMTIPSSGTVKLTLSEYEPSVYDWTISVEVAPPENTNLVDPFAISPPTSLNLTSGNSTMIEAEDGTIIHRILAGWTAPADTFVIGYKVYVKIGAGTEDFYQAINDPATTELYITPVEIGTLYTIYIYAINSLNKVSAALTNSITPSGKTNEPTDVTSGSMTPYDSQIKIAILGISDNDLAFYRYRKGTVWGTYTEEIEIKSTVIYVDASGTGTQNWMVKAVNTSGIEAATAYSIPSITFNPPALTPTLAASTSEFMVADDGQTWSRIKVTWTPVSDVYVSGYEIRHRTQGGTDYTYSPFIPGRLTAISYVSSMIGYDYEVGIRSVSQFSDGTDRFVSAWTTANITSTGIALVGFDSELPATDAFNNLSYYWRYVFDTLDPFTNTSGAVLTATDGVVITAGSSAGLLTRSIARPPVPLTWSKDRYFKTIVNISNGANLVTTGSNPYLGQTNNSGSPEKIHFKFKWNSGTSKIEIDTYSSTTSGSETVTAATSGVSISDGSDISLEYYYNATAQTIDFVISDGTTTWTTQHTSVMPSGSSAVMLFILFAFATTAAGNYTIKLTEMATVQRK